MRGSVETRNEGKMDFDIVIFTQVFTLSQFIAVIVLGLFIGFALDIAEPRLPAFAFGTTLIGFVFFVSAVVDSVVSNGPYERVFARVLLWLIFCSVWIAIIFVRKTIANSK